MRDLIALLERYVPGCSNQIQGVSTAEIDFLEDAFGQPLPDAYRFFALEMGRDGGPLLAHVRSYNPFDIADKYKITSNDIPPRRFLFIFGDPDPLTRFHYWLDLEAPSEDGDFQVVQFPYFQDAWKTKLILSYVGLQEMLFDWAMEYVCVPSFSHRARYRQGDGEMTTVKDVANYLEQMGFIRLPYPRYNLLFERDDAAIGLYRFPDSSHFQMHVGMRSLDKLKHFQAVIEDNTDLMKSNWKP